MPPLHFGMRENDKLPTWAGGYEESGFYACLLCLCEIVATFFMNPGYVLKKPA
jgi:hypothetical protein